MADEILAMLRQLKTIEQRTESPTHDEWMGVLHDIAINSEIRMSYRIRALAQMDRCTGEPGDLTAAAVEQYTADTSE